MVAPTIGVLAIQGDVEAHCRMIEKHGAVPREVRLARDLEGLGGLILPGGESTAMTIGLDRDGTTGPLREAISGGLPTLATCAGMILLSRSHLDILDISVTRNAFGRQVHSFEADLTIDGAPVHAIFIRAPWIDEAGDGVEVLAEVDGHGVACRQGAVTALSFHPEIAGEERFHRALISAARG